MCAEMRERGFSSATASELLGGLEWDSTKERLAAPREAQSMVDLVVLNKPATTIATATAPHSPEAAPAPVTKRPDPTIPNFTGKALARRSVDGFGELAIQDARTHLVVHEWRDGSDHWVVRDARVSTDYREYADAYLERVEREIVAQHAESVGAAATSAPDDGEEPAPMTAKEIQALDWHALRAACRDLPEGAAGSRGDLLRRLGEANGVSAAELGLEDDEE